LGVAGRRSGEGAAEGPGRADPQLLWVVPCRMKTILSNQTVDIPKQGRSAGALGRRPAVQGPAAG